MRSSRICWASRLLLCLAALWLAPQAQAAIALVNTASGSDFTGTALASISTGSGINISAGNLIVVFCSGQTTAISTATVSDTGSANSFTQIAAHGSQDSVQITFADYAKNSVSVAGDIFKCTFSASQAFPAIVVLQYSGADTSAPLDTSAVGDAFGTSVTSAAFTTTSANELLVAGFSNRNTSAAFTAGAGYAVEVNDSNQITGAEDQLVTSIQSGATASVSYGAAAAEWEIIVATFKQAASASGRTLLGVGQ